MNIKDDTKFKIYYQGETLYIKKSKLNFVDGYAIVEKDVKSSDYSASAFCGGITLRGIVDENYHTVLEFKTYFTKLMLFPKGNVLADVRTYVSEKKKHLVRYEIRHHKINSNKHFDICGEVMKWDVADSALINETTIKVKNKKESKEEFEALYDVVKGQMISRKFTKIEDFENVPGQSEEKMAKAILKLKGQNKSYKTYDLVCYIDETGKIRTPLYNSLSNSYIETTSNDFNFENAVLSIQKDIDLETKDKVVENNLLKKLSY